MSWKCMYPKGEGFEINNEVRWFVKTGSHSEILKERTGELICKPFTEINALDVWLVKPSDSAELVLLREEDMEAYYWD